MDNLYKYSVIIADYKSYLKTIKYIEEFSLKCQNINEVKFVIIDNSPECNEEFSLWEIDKNEEFIWRDKRIIVRHRGICNSDVVCLQPFENLGYAKANNLGAVYSASTNRRIKFFIFSNNDIFFYKKFNLSLYDDLYKRDKRYVVMGPRIIGINGAVQSPGMEFDFWAVMLKPYWTVLSGGRLKSKSRIIDKAKDGSYGFLSGCFLVAQKEAFMRVDGFDEGTFLYYEEDILYQKIKKVKKKFYFTTQMELIHEGGITTGTHFSALAQEKIMFKSGCYYFEKYRRVSLWKVIFAKIHFHAVFIPLYKIAKLLRYK